MSLRETPPVPNQVPQTEVDRANARETIERSTQEAPLRRSRYSLKQKLGAGAGVLIFSVGAAAGINRLVSSDDSPTQEQQSQTTSIPGEIGVPGNTLDTVNTHPSEALMAEALMPPSVAEFPTANAAAEHFEDLFNIRQLSATVNLEGSDYVEPQQSIDYREKLDNVIWGSNLDGSNHDNMDKLRRAIGIILGSITTSTPGTWRDQWDISPAEDNSSIFNV
jgi:hypothetical protein